MSLRTAAVFSSNMVLQRGKRIPVWGIAEANTGVGCVLRPLIGPSISAYTRAGEQGHWELTLPALPGGGPYTMLVQSGGESLEYQNIWLGEVWLAGGQSNMELPLDASEGGSAALAACTDPRIHFYETPKAATSAAADTVHSSWQVAAPHTAAKLSAVAYYAARELAQALDLHVGILECFWGGTYAHCWLPRALLAQFPEGQRRLAWYDKRVGDKTDRQFDAECAAYQSEVDDWNARIAARRAIDPNVSWTVLYAECGLYPWPPPAGRTSFQHPGNLYENMLARICPYSIRGFWYYQGEQDEEWPQDYQALLTALVRRWRMDWNDPFGDMPFLLLQLPMYGTQYPGAWPLLRQAQSTVAHQEPNMGLVVLADLGERDNIHPTNKRTPGQRLALRALEQVYHHPVQGIPPELEHAVCEGPCVLLHFRSIGGGLYLKGAGRGFQLAGSDGRFYDADVLLLRPDTLCLRCSSVPVPTAVRYAWADYGPAELYGGTGLAAAPFHAQL